MFVYLIAGFSKESWKCGWLFLGWQKHAFYSGKCMELFTGDFIHLSIQIYPFYCGIFNYVIFGSKQSGRERLVPRVKVCKRA